MTDSLLVSFASRSQRKWNFTEAEPQAVPGPLLWPFHAGFGRGLSLSSRDSPTQREESGCAFRDHSGDCYNTK